MASGSSPSYRYAIHSDLREWRPPTPSPPPLQVFLVDFFADSQATAEWRVLCSYLAELQERGGKGLDGFQYGLQQVGAAPGAAAEECGGGLGQAVGIVL